MINESYVPADFAEEIAIHMLNGDQEDLAEFLSMSTCADLYYDFSVALEAIGITSLEEAYCYGTDNRDNVNIGDLFYRVDGNTITSGNRVDDLYSARGIRDEIVRVFMQDYFFGNNNEILKKICCRYSVAKLGGAIYSLHPLSDGTAINLAKMLSSNDYDENCITDMLEDFNLAYIKE